MYPLEHLQARYLALRLTSPRSLSCFIHNHLVDPFLLLYPCLRPHRPLRLWRLLFPTNPPYYPPSLVTLRVLFRLPRVYPSASPGPRRRTISAISPRRFKFAALPPPSPLFPRTLLQTLHLTTWRINGGSRNQTALPLRPWSSKRALLNPFSWGTNITN